MTSPFNDPADLRPQLARIEARLDKVISLCLAAPTHMAPDLGLLEAHHQAAGLLSRDHVQLIGFDLRINGRAVSLTKRQAVLSAILIRHALRGDADFLPTVRIIEEIEADFADAWWMPTPEDIHTCVCSLRKKIGLSRDLLESSTAKAGGLRISTPRENIVPLKSPWSVDPGHRTSL